MPRFETQEQVDKAIEAMKAYRGAKRLADKAAGVVIEKLGALKTITGITSNDGLRIEEEVRTMLGDVMVDGIPEQR
jgi:hypothetical protein